MGSTSISRECEEQQQPRSPVHPRMLMSSRCYFYTFCFFVISSFLLSFYVQGTIFKKSTQPVKLTFVRDPITALDSRILIISPYYDPRPSPSVRVLAIIHESVKEIYCLFNCLLNRTISVRASIDLHSDRFGFPYGTADLLCKEPSECNYRYISFQSPNSTVTTERLLFEVKNHPLPSISSNFTVCISSIYGGYNNVLQMVQSIEMYKILGVSRVTIYNTSCSQNIDKVLHYYIDEGTLEVVPWPINQYLNTSKEWRYSEGLTSQVGYYGQTAALNDCLYRNMYKSKFVLLHDIDEIILPVQDEDWFSLMEHLQRLHPDTSVFCFEDHVFTTSASASGFDLWPDIPGVNILLHPFREPINWNEFINRKMIVNPRQIFQTSIHSALKHTGTTKNITQNIGISFHCRSQERKNITTDQLIRDDILRMYNVSLVPKINGVIRKLFTHS
ncbi:uncharacterized protein [Hyperolius riggenbachi]|uniref:uncharacterized protein n=1 Tax=Hyperolius riggenbachi TaxID=752182 RepID=UPI0035A36CE0